MACFAGMWQANLRGVTSKSVVFAFRNLLTVLTIVCDRVSLQQTCMINKKTKSEKKKLCVFFFHILSSVAMFIFSIY